MEYRYIEQKNRKSRQYQLDLFEKQELLREQKLMSKNWKGFSAWQQTPVLTIAELYNSFLKKYLLFIIFLCMLLILKLGCFELIIMEKQLSLQLAAFLNGLVIFLCRHSLWKNFVRYGSTLLLPYYKSKRYSVKCSHFGRPLPYP